MPTAEQYAERPELMLALPVGARACVRCGERDIPAFVPGRVTWLWGTDRGPEHPWCDPHYWPRLDRAARRQIMAMVDRCRRGEL